MDKEEATKVSWECGGSACEDMEDCLTKLAKAPKDEEFIICSRKEERNGFLQASYNGDGTYYCEVSLPSECKEIDIFANPDSASLEDLASLFYRYSQGEDFSWARDSWNNVDFKSSGKLEKKVISIVLAIVAAVFLVVYFYNN